MKTKTFRQLQSSLSLLVCSHELVLEWAGLDGTLEHTLGFHCSVWAWAGFKKMLVVCKPVFLIGLECFLGELALEDMRCFAYKSGFVFVISACDCLELDCFAEHVEEVGFLAKVQGEVI